MASLVSQKLSPREARFQLCLADGVEPPRISACEAEVAAELAHLRWILLTQWKCRACGDPHIHCACKPAWVMKLL
jgi:hypothetical protein